MAEEKPVEVERLRMKILPDYQNAQGPLREFIGEYRSRREWLAQRHQEKP